MTNRKKVVHLTTVHHPFDTRIYHKECFSLHKAGYDVSLIAPLENKPRGAKVMTDDGIKLIATTKRKNRLVRMLLSTWETYRLAKREQANYYHFHDPELLWVGWLLKKKTNNVIYDVHEDYLTSISQKEYFAKPIKKIVALLYDKMEAFLIKKMDICLAEKYYQERYPTGQPILNYPVLNEQLLNAQRDDQEPADAVIYTGNVTEVRGSYLHAILPNLPSKLDIYFYGKCQQFIADKMKQLAGESKDKLHFTGIDHFVERQEIDKGYLKQNWLAGMAIFPPTDHYKRKELTKFFEYMTAGIPVVCSNFPTWQAFIDQHECGLTVDPDHPEQWEEALVYLRSHPEERKQMIQNGRQAVRNELNWQVEEKRLLTWYQEIHNHL
ncbi:glycosyltransferase [Amphibacillus sp. Q70]|uniref:glycosyltransferase n=1 Tax=Amphibacillus sp. Q70 TaxID=3453416 RepID=UPI003F838CCD